MTKATRRLRKCSEPKKHFRGHSCDIVPFTELSWYEKYRKAHPDRILVWSHDVNHTSVSMENGHLVTAGCGIRGGVPDVNQDPAVFDICTCTSASGGKLLDCLREMVAERLKNDLAVAKKLVDELMREGRITGKEAERICSGLSVIDFGDWLVHEKKREISDAIGDSHTYFGKGR